MWENGSWQISVSSPLSKVKYTAANFMNTSDFLLEGDFRKMLAANNVQPDAIEEIVQEARQNPM